MRFASSARPRLSAAAALGADAAHLCGFARRHPRRRRAEHSRYSWQARQRGGHATLGFARSGLLERRGAGGQSGQRPINFRRSILDLARSAVARYRLRATVKSQDRAGCRREAVQSARRAATVPRRDLSHAAPTRQPRHEVEEPRVKRGVDDVERAGSPARRRRTTSSSESRSITV